MAQHEMRSPSHRVVAHLPPLGRCHLQKLPAEAKGDNMNPDLIRTSVSITMQFRVRAALEQAAETAGTTRSLMVIRALQAYPPVAKVLKQREKKS